MMLFVSMQVLGQCPSGMIVFRETFGGSYSSVDIGSALTSGTSPYTFSGNTGIAPGEYGLRKRTGGINNWADGSDNTGQGGYMMMVRSKISMPLFYETTVQGFCRANSQAVCFAAASLSKIDARLDASIHVEVRNATTGSLLATYTSAALKNNDSISWSTYTFSYPLPKGVSAIKLSFSFTSSSSSPDDFAIDDIRLVSIGATTVSGNESGIYPLINGRYEYPVFACLNERVVFTMANGQPVPGREYQWERMLPNQSYEAIPGATSNIFVIDSAKRADSRFYRLREADSGYIHSTNCSTPSSPSGLHVDPEPQISGLTPICEGTDLNIQVDEGSYVTWTGPNGFTATGRKVYIPKTTVANGGIYAANVTYNAGCELKFLSKKEVVIIKNPIKLDLPADTTICRGNSVTLDATNDPGMLYVWSTGDNTPTIRVKDDGLYGVIVFANGNCSRYDSIYVHVVERPGVSLRSDTALCAGDTLLLNPVTTNVNKYKWSNGAVTSVISVTQKGLYSLQVSNNCGTNTASVNIGFAKCSEDLFVPSAFTPNRDGLNDVFRAAQDISLKQFRMKIYNRSGQSIFNSNSINKGWDGTINRVDQPLGTYIWVIDYTSKTGKQYTINGTVTLIR